MLCKQTRARVPSVGAAHEYMTRLAATLSQLHRKYLSFESTRALRDLKQSVVAARGCSIKVRFTIRLKAPLRDRNGSFRTRAGWDGSDARTRDDRLSRERIVSRKEDERLESEWWYLPGSPRPFEPSNSAQSSSECLFERDDKRQIPPKYYFAISP